MEKNKFEQLNVIVWVKTNPPPLNSKINYLSNAKEFAVTGIKKNKPTFNSEYDKAVYEYPKSSDRKLTWHPTKKSLPLFEELIKVNSNEGKTETILSPKLAFDFGDGWGLYFDTVLGHYTSGIHARADVVKMLLDAGEDPNCQDTRFDHTPLHNVVSGNERVKLGKLLLEYGADPLLTGKHGETPLVLAKELSKDQEMIDLLTEATETALKSST